MNACTTTARATSSASPQPVATIAVAWARHFGEWLADRARKARDREELAQMSERELRDIGLARRFVDDVASVAWHRDVLR